MEIKDSKNINTGPIDTNGGNVHLGDNYYKSIEYKEILEKISLLEIAYSTKEGEEKIKFHQQLEDEKSKLEEFKQGVISLAETFQKIEINSDRLKSAQSYFEAGKFKEARAILDTEQIGRDQEQLLQRKEELEKNTDKNNEDLKNNADEYLVLAKLTAIDFNQVDRFEKTIQYYESSLMSNRNKDNLFDFAYFLQEHNQNNKATPLYEETLEIIRKLAEVNPQTYLPDVAMTLNNLGILQSDKNEFDKAEKSYGEALKIGRKLAEVNPQTYLPDVATTLNNLGILQSDKNEFDKAEKSYEEALEIRRKLAEVNPQTYLPDVATTLNNLGNLQRVKNEFDKAEKSYEEALEIRRKLAEVNPQTYLPNVAMTQINMSIFYIESKVNKQLSIKLVEEAISNLLPFAHIPYIQNYLKAAFKVLKYWDIDVEEYLKEKTAAN